MLSAAYEAGPSILVCVSHGQQRELSKSQIDRLGDRLRRGSATEDDRRVLDEYRRSFASAYETVFAGIITKLNLEPTGRSKTIDSIVDKLSRESVRLSQIQDIAGCRIVVDDIATQERALTQLRSIFPSARIVDRRKQASHGYRAIHLIVEVGARPVEIQLRTTLEHRWAELSEKLSDVWGSDTKYGGGPLQIRQALDERSQSVERVEQREIALHALSEAMRELRAKEDLGGLTPTDLQSVERDAAAIAAELAKARKELFDVFDRTLAVFTKAQ